MLLPLPHLLVAGITGDDVVVAVPPSSLVVTGGSRGIFSLAPSFSEVVIVVADARSFTSWWCWWLSLLL